VTPTGWIAVGLLLVCLYLIIMVELACDQRDAARADLQHALDALNRLEARADELTLDYGAEIGRSKRMALRAVERAQ